MIFLYFLNRYINRLSDYQYEQFYEKWFITRFKNSLTGAFIYFIVGTIIITEILMLGSEGVFLSILVYLGVLMFYGSFFVSRVLKYYQLFNKKYMLIKMGQSSTDFSKDNVVN